MRHALVIEDNDNNMELITLLLRAGGYEPRGAITGRQGIESALQEQTDFILLDVQLPDIDGEEVVRTLRASGCRIPVIALTSYAMSGDRERLLAAGCDGYIEKPIDPETILSQIRRVLEAHR